jgi:hypothetical protein
MVTSDLWNDPPTQLHAGEDFPFAVVKDLLGGTGFEPVTSTV